ncbi:hypothetical protein EV361DRAFT_874513 [Lentinula raphanica]|nr:hypothetical protein EV361DRAFT_874513 [Lentinula raphanica]
MPEQNPTKLYWTCPVYAKTDMIEESKKKQKTSFKGKSKTDDSVVGPMRSTMRYNELEPYYPEDPNYLPEYSQEEPDHQHVIDFFKSPNFPNVVAMRIPKDQDHKYIQAWGLLARCYDCRPGNAKKKDRRYPQNTLDEFRLGGKFELYAQCTPSELAIRLGSELIRVSNLDADSKVLLSSWGLLKVLLLFSHPPIPSPTVFNSLGGPWIKIGIEGVWSC